MRSTDVHQSCAVESTPPRPTKPVSAYWIATMKPCPLCKEFIHDEAIKCRHCSSMLVSISEQRATDQSKQVTYVLDRDLVRFGKFAAAVLGVFLIVGTYLFGFKLENALEKVSDTQVELTKAQKELSDAKTAVTELKKEVTSTLATAKAHLAEISQQRRLAFEIVIAMGNQKRLSDEERERLKIARQQSPDKFRQTDLGAKLWPVGATIRIRFLDGNPELQEKVKQVALEWIKEANLAFQFVTDGESDIRISFKDYGSWSYRGTDCLVVPSNRATMNFGWLGEQVPSTEVRAVVLREFGHALGLVNEHQNPKANLPWNSDAVRKFFEATPNFWPREKVNEDVLRKFSIDELPDYREFDPTSIMMQPFPKELFNVPNFEIKRPMDLSESDRQLILRLYPKTK